MPLHGQNEMIGRSSFQSFDDAVIGTVGDDPQADADRCGGLMMRGVDRDDDRASHLRRRTSARTPALCSHDCRQFRIRLNLDRVSDCNAPACLVIHFRARFFR